VIFALKSSPLEVEDLDGGVFDCKVKSEPHPDLPLWKGKEISVHLCGDFCFEVFPLGGGRFRGVGI